MNDTNNISLIDDPFFLHTFLEEYISSNVGNNRFSSFDSFVKFCPPHYARILLNSVKYVDQIQELSESLANINIILQKTQSNYNYYDSDSDDDYGGSVSSKIAKYDVDNEMSEDTRDKLLHDYSYESDVLFILNSNIFVKRIKDRNGYYDDEYRGYISDQNFVGYSTSDVAMDMNVENKMNTILNNIVTDVVNNSRHQDIFIPIGYFNYRAGGHLIGMIISRYYINIFNGGDGIQYHSIGSNSGSTEKDQPRYPQCHIKLNRPSDIKLERLLKALIVLSNSYVNTTIDHVYSELFSIDINERFYDYTKDHKLVNTTIIDILKRIVTNGITSKMIRDTKLIMPKGNSNKNKEQKYTSHRADEPILKHTDYYKKRCYRPKYSQNINNLIMNKLATVFTKDAMDDMKNQYSYMSKVEINKFLSKIIELYDKINRDVSLIVKKEIEKTSTVVLIKNKSVQNNYRYDYSQTSDKRSDYHLISTMEILITRHIMEYINTYKSYDNLTFTTEIYLEIADHYKNSIYSNIVSEYAVLLLNDKIKDDNYAYVFDEEYIMMRDDYDKFQERNRDENKSYYDYDYDKANKYDNKRDKIRSNLINAINNNGGATYVASYYLPISINIKNINELSKLENTINKKYLSTDFPGGLENLENHVIESIKNVFTENIIGVECTDSSIESHQLFTDVLINDLVYSGGRNIFDYEVCFEINGKNINRKNDMLMDLDTNTDSDENDINSLISTIIGHFDIYKQLYQKPILTSVDPDKGYMREQYSGSCSYNGILYAVHSTADSTLNDIKYDIGLNILNDKLFLIGDNKLKLKHEDVIVIETIKINIKNRFDSTLLYIKEHPENMNVMYQESEKPLTPDEKIKIRNDAIESYIKSIQTKYDRMLVEINKLEKYLSVREYPTIEIYDVEEDSPNNSNQRYNQVRKVNEKNQPEEFDEYSRMDEYEKIDAKMKDITDIGKMMNEIIDYNKDDGKRYTEFIMNKVIELIRTFTESDTKINNNDKINIVNQIYKNVITTINENKERTEHIRKHSSYLSRDDEDKKKSWVDITVLYILLFCMDHLLFMNYKGFDPQSDERYAYYDKIENNLVRNLYLIGHLSDINLNHMISMIQRYAMFYPINTDSYYIEMIGSIKRSGITTLKSYSLGVNIDLTDSNIDKINTDILKIGGILLINELVTINFGSPIPSYSTDKGVKSIHVVEYNGPNEKLSKIVNEITINKHYGPYITKYDDILNKGDEPVKLPFYSTMSLLNRVERTLNRNENEWEIYSKKQGLTLFHFNLGNSVNNNEFTFDMTFNARDINVDKVNKVIRIKPRSNVVILNVDKFTPPNESRYLGMNVFRLSSQYPISEIHIFDFNKDNDDFVKLFDAHYTDYVIDYYVARPLKNLNFHNIIDIEDIHASIMNGDLEIASKKLDGYSIDTGKSEYSSRINMYYALFPHNPNKNEDNTILPKMNAYVIGNNIVNHNPFDITKHLNYYRSIMKKLLEDPLIIALYNDQSNLESSYSTNYKKKVCNGLKNLLSLFGLSDEVEIKYVKSIETKEKPTHFKIVIHSGRFDSSKKEKEERKTNEFIFPGTYDKETSTLMLNNFKIIWSPNLMSLVENMFKNNNNTKSLNVLHNALHIALEIDNCLIGIKLNNNNSLTQIRLFVFSGNTIRSNLKELSSVIPWNKLKQKNKTNKKSHGYDDNRKHFPQPPSFDSRSTSFKANNITYVTFNAYQFESIIPDVNITDNDDSNMFLEFCYFLLVNQSYKILNMYLPTIVSIYHTNKIEYAKVFVDFMLDNKYFNSPYNYYILNKLYFMIKGEFNSEFVYDLSKRQSYYPKIYTDVNSNTKLIEFKIHDELSIYYEWLRMIKPYVNNVNKEVITLDALKSIVTEIDKLIHTKNIVYMNVKIDDVLTFGDPMRYLMNESNYRAMFSNIQLDILSKIRSIAFDNKIMDDSEIMGNIKYFINDTFDHSKLSPVMLHVDAAIKLFELTTGKIVDSVQYKFIHNMINDDNNANYKVYELLMGRGKTYVIIPCILLTYYYNQKYQNVIQCVPSHLITQSSKILGKFLPFMTTGYIYNLHVERTGTDSYGNRNSKRKNNFSSVIQSIVTKIIITDDINIKTDLLVRVENELMNKSESADKNNQYGGGYIEYNYDQSVIAKITDPIISSIESNRRKDDGTDTDAFKINNEHLANRSIIAIDEFDMLIDPLRSDLNFPTGDYSNVDHQDILIKIVLNVTRELFIKYHTYMTKSDRTNELTNKLIIRKIMLEMNTMIYEDLKRIIRTVYRRFRQYRQKTNKNLPELFTPLTKDENVIINDTASESNLSVKLVGGGFDELLIYYVRETYKIYQNAMTMLLDKDYGWDDTDPKNPFIAIPYSAQDTPMKGSQFSDIIINIILTSITYCQKGMRAIDITKYIKFIKFSSKRIGTHQLKNFFKIDPKLIDLAMIESENGFNDYLQYLYENRYDEYINAVCLYLEKIVLIQYVKMDPDILNTSFIDIIDPNFIKAKFAMSGTTNVHLPKFKYYGDTNVLNRIVKDDITHRYIQLALRGDNLGTHKSGKANVLVIKSDSNTNDILKMMDNYQVLIDTGSFLRYDSNLSIAHKLSEIYEDHYIVFFDENDRPVVIINGDLIDYDITQLKYEKLYKVYYDQKHTVGTDLDLPSFAKCIITVHKFNTHTQIVQGLFRMREINYYQHQDYLIKDDTDNQLNIIAKTATDKNKTKDKLENLIKFLQDNEDKRFRTSKFKYLQQLSLCLYRTLSDYTPESYLVKVFVPSEDTIDSTIMKDYNYNFYKVHFINMMNNNIKPYTTMIKSQQTQQAQQFIQPSIKSTKTSRSTGLSQQQEKPSFIQTQKITQTTTQSKNEKQIQSKVKLLNELSGTIQTINNTDSDTSSLTIQKQSENVKNINMEVAFERNYRYHDRQEIKPNMSNITYGDFITKLGCINMVDNTILQLCKDPTLDMSIVDERYDDVYNKGEYQTKNWVKRKVPLIEYVQSLGVSISPVALHTIHKMFNKEESELFFKCYNKTTKVNTLLTSADVVFIRVRYQDVLEMLDIKPLIEFNKDPINNLMFMLKFGIPADESVVYLADDLIRSKRDIILDYYNKYFVYKLISVSPAFYKFLSKGITDVADVIGQ